MKTLGFSVLFMVLFIPGSSGHWSPWSPCSKTCGGGTQSRKNEGCIFCFDGEYEHRDCNTQHCPIDGSWSSWFGWSTCSTTCGDGMRRRVRTCTEPEPAYGGNTCPGEANQQSTCKLMECPVHGNWSAWSDWSSCSVSCDNGIRTRNRSCDTPTPDHGGMDCGGNDTEVEECNMDPCIETTTFHSTSTTEEASTPADQQPGLQLAQAGNSDGMSLGAIVSIPLAVIIGAVVAALAFCYCRRKRQEKMQFNDPGIAVSNVAYNCSNTTLQTQLENENETESQSTNTYDSGYAEIGEFHKNRNGETNRLAMMNGAYEHNQYATIDDHQFRNSHHNVQNVHAAALNNYTDLDELVKSPEEIHFSLDGKDEACYLSPYTNEPSHGARLNCSDLAEGIGHKELRANEYKTLPTGRINVNTSDTLGFIADDYTNDTSDVDNAGSGICIDNNHHESDDAETGVKDSGATACLSKSGYMDMSASMKDRHKDPTYDFPTNNELVKDVNDSEQDPYV